jgi:hypothetical protein
MLICDVEVIELAFVSYAFVFRHWLAAFVAKQLLPGTAGGTCC